jgi:hypothetical protein
MIIIPDVWECTLFHCESCQYVGRPNHEVKRLLNREFNVFNCCNFQVVEIVILYLKDEDVCISVAIMALGVSVFGINAP